MVVTDVVVQHHAEFASGGCLYTLAMEPGVIVRTAVVGSHTRPCRLTGEYPVEVTPETMSNLPAHVVTSVEATTPTGNAHHNLKPLAKEYLNAPKSMMRWQAIANEAEKLG